MSFRCIWVHFCFFSGFVLPTSAQSRVSQLTLTDYLYHRLSGICSVFRGHYSLFLSSFMTFHPTSATNGAGNDFPFRSTWGHPWFLLGFVLDQSLRFEPPKYLCGIFKLFFWWVHCPYNRHTISMLVQGRIQPRIPLKCTFSISLTFLKTSRVYYHLIFDRNKHAFEGS